MSESDETRPEEGTSPAEEIRTEEPKAPFGADEPNPAVASDETSAETEASGEDVTPHRGGYVDRDPKGEMPIIPSVPGTEEDPKEHDAAPPKRKDQTSPGYE